MRSKLTYANVMSTIAVLIAIAGGTSAVAGIKLGKNSVGKRELAKGAVTAKALGRVVVRTETHAAGIGDVSCAPGERLLSGGSGGSAGPVTATLPSTSKANTWRGSAAGPVFVYSLCLKK